MQRKGPTGHSEKVKATSAGHEREASEALAQRHLHLGHPASRAVEKLVFVI